MSEMLRQMRQSMRSPPCVRTGKHTFAVLLLLSYSRGEGSHLTGVQQHVADEHPLVGSGEAALRTLVDLLVGVHLAHMVLVGHWVEGGKGAECAAQLFTARVALLLVFAEQVLVGAGKVTVGAVEGIVALVVGLHGFCCGKEHGTRVMAALHSPHPMALLQVLYEGLAVGHHVAAALLKAAEGQWLGRSCCRVALEMLFKGLAEAEFLTADGTGIGVRVEVGNILVHAGHVAVECIPLHCTVVAQWAAVGLLAQLPEQMGLELALTGEELLAVGALEAGVWEVEMQVLHQMGPLLKAALAFWTPVGLEEGLGARSHIPWERERQRGLRARFFKRPAAG